MIGVVVPVHNEERTLARCLRALVRAAAHPRLEGETVRIVVVLDDCTDASAGIARRFPVEIVESEARNVGIARATGVRRLLPAEPRWLAFTDADSRVAADWLADQLSLRADVVCGAVAVHWEPQSAHLRKRYRERYTHRDGHRHIHGANLGMTGEAYRRAGGFPPLPVSEDVALVQKLAALGADIAWSALPRVLTSSRLKGRAAGGFADYLAALA